MSVITGSQKLTSELQIASTTIPGGVALASSISVGFKPAQPAGTAGAADNVDVPFIKTLTLSATPTVLDLTNLTDPYGVPISFARVRSVYIKNRSTTDGQNVLFGFSGTTTNAWTALVSNPGQNTIHASTATNDGVFYHVASTSTGMVVSSSNKLLNLDPGANTIVVDVIILGCSV